LQDDREFSLLKREKMQKTAEFRTNKARMKWLRSIVMPALDQAPDTKI